MSDNQVIRQDSAENVMWRLFRIQVEETEIPEETHNKMREQIEEIHYEY